MSTYCPTPHKEVYYSHREALRVVKRMRAQVKRTASKRYTPVEPYPCRCGNVHLTTVKR